MTTPIAELDFVGKYLSKVMDKLNPIDEFPVAEAATLLSIATP